MSLTLQETPNLVAMRCVSDRHVWQFELHASGDADTGEGYIRADALDFVHVCATFLAEAVRLKVVHPNTLRAIQREAKRAGMQRSKEEEPF